MAIELKEKTFDELSFGSKGEISCSGTLDGGAILFEVDGGLCWVKTGPTAIAYLATPTQVAEIFAALEAQFGVGNITKTPTGEIIHLHPKKSRTERAIEGAKGATSIVFETTAKVGKAVYNVGKTVAKEVAKPTIDTDLKAALDPDGDGLINFDGDLLGEVHHVDDGVVYKVTTGGLRKKITQSDTLLDVADELTAKYCRGKDFKVDVKDGKLVLIHAPKQREPSPEYKAVGNALKSVRERIKKAREPKVDKAAKRASDATRIAALEANTDMQGILDDVRMDVRDGLDFSDIITDIEKNTVRTIDYGNLEELIGLAIEYLTLTGEIEGDEAKRLRSEKNKLRKAKETADKKGLVRFVQGLREKGISEQGIRTRLKAKFKDELGEGEEAQAAYNYALEIAGDRKRSGRFNRAKTRVPFAEERTWDKVLREHNIVSKIRAKREEKVGDKKKDDHTIEVKLKEELDNILGDYPRFEEILDYAFSQADSKSFHEESALIFARTHGLIEEVRDQLEEKKYDSEEDETKKQAILAAVKTDLREKIKQLGAAEGNTFTDKEIDKIVKTSFEGTASKTETVVKGLGKLWKLIKSPFSKESKKHGEHSDDDKESWFTRNKDTVVDIAKWSTLGVGVLTLGTLAALYGVVRAVVWGLTHMGPVLRGAGRLGLNVVGRAFTHGGPLIKSVAQTALVNPLKATGRIISSPFKRAYQAFNWGRKYPSKPADYKPTVSKWNFWYKKPWQWTRNLASGGAYRAKQAALASTAAAGFLLYGGFEGITNAVSKDLIGLEWQAPSPKFLEATSKRSGGESKKEASQEEHPKPH